MKRTFPEAPLLMILVYLGPQGQGSGVPYWLYLFDT